MNVEKKVFKRKIERMKGVKRNKVQTQEKEANDEEGPGSDYPSTTPMVPQSVLTDIDFETLRGEISDKTLSALADMGFKKMTEIQSKTIKPLLAVRNLFSTSSYHGSYFLPIVLGF